MLFEEMNGRETMNWRAVIVTVLVAICALGAVISVGRYGSDLTVNASNKSTKSNISINPVGPQPKAVVDSNEYNIGVISVGQEGSHKFEVRNEGEAPLEIEIGRSTCKCTVSSLTEGENIVPPGESTEVTLTWKTNKAYKNFRQEAEIKTNDPKAKSLYFTITGRVTPIVEMVPTIVWKLSHIKEEKPTKVSGQIYSNVIDEFKIEGIEASHKLISTDFSPLEQEALDEIGAKTGYRVNVQVQPGLPVGLFRENITIHTDVNGGTDVVRYLEGTRFGPIEIIPVGNTRWSAANSTVVLGRFRATEGANAEFLLFVSGLHDKDFELLDIKCDDNAIAVEAKQDDNFKSKSRKRVRLKFIVKPGARRRVRGTRDPATVELKTNHPKAGVIRFSVHYATI